MTRFSNEASFFYRTGAPDSLAAAGFRSGAVGTHTSRTMMLAEISSVLAHTGPTATRNDYRSSVIKENCLGKATTSTRRLSFQRLSELYGLDPDIALFRILRRLWTAIPATQPQLALLVALARDPLLRGSAPAVLALDPREEFDRSDAGKALREATEGRLNDAILAKAVRNCASTWAQSGHLEGRTFKKRVLVKPAYPSVTLALAIAYLAGFRGSALFECAWIRVLDCTPVHARELALESKRSGLVDLVLSGDIVEFRLDRLDPIFNQA